MTLPSTPSHRVTVVLLFSLAVSFSIAVVLWPVYTAKVIRGCEAITLQIKSHPRISTKLPQSPTFGPDSSVTRKKRVRPSRRRSSSSPSTYQRNNRTRELSRLRKPNSRPPIFLMFFGSLPLSSFYLAILARNIAILIPVRKSTLSHPQAPTNAST